MNSTLDRAKNGLWQACNVVRHGYECDEHNSSVLNAMSHWLADAPHPQVDGAKGILLRGPVGTGKSDLMRALSRTMVIGGGQGFKVVNAIRAVKEFNQTKDEHGRDIGGDGAILKYAECGPLCIDDLGREDVGKHYGKECNVIGDIVALRYERWRFDPVKYQTHFTTNIPNEELRNRYDERFISRLGEMCSVLVLGGPDRRDVIHPEPAQKGLFQQIEEAPPMSPEAYQENIARLKKAASEAAKEIDHKTKPVGERASSPTHDATILQFTGHVSGMTPSELGELKEKILGQYEPDNPQAKPFLEAIDQELSNRATTLRTA